MLCIIKLFAIRCLVRYVPHASSCVQFHNGEFALRSHPRRKNRLGFSVCDAKFKSSMNCCCFNFGLAYMDPIVHSPSRVVSVINIACGLAMRCVQMRFGFLTTMCDFEFVALKIL